MATFKNVPKKRKGTKKDTPEVVTMLPEDEKELLAYYAEVQRELDVKYFLLGHNRDVRDEMAKKNMAGIPGITKAVQAIIQEIAQLLLKREEVEQVLASSTTKSTRKKTNPTTGTPKKAKKKGPKKEK